MFSSETISREMSRNMNSSSSSSFLLSNPSNNSSFKHVPIRDSMGSDLFLNETQVVDNNEQQGSGLARYRSAPSSFLAALLDSTADNSSSGDESEALFSALMDGPPPPPPPPPQKMHYHMKQEVGAESELRPGQNGSVNGQMGYEYSVGLENQVHLRMNSGSNLLRQSSSPAGLFNGYGMIGEVENYRVRNHSKASSSSAAAGGGMSNHMNLSSAPSSSSRFMPSIPENVNESIGTSSTTHENGHLASGNYSASGREFDSLFPQDSWNDFNNLKRNRDDMKMFSSFTGMENQNVETRKNPHGLLHHLSLPKTASEMADVEKFLQVQTDTVPCQIRAKRGFATHPRSIAERMRRTRISEKMKKLQDLFPNMDKQTSTADMLDLAVQFIKDLQEQVETLTETRAKCVCLKRPPQTPPSL